MCGIFGLVRNVSAAHPERASAVLIELGMSSIERGRDSSGLAFIPSSHRRAAFDTYPTSHQVNSHHADIGGIVIAKETTAFDTFWGEKENYLPLVAHSVAVIGHTRSATQGSRSARSNASPLAVGALIGTHNGDIDAESVISRTDMVQNIGHTDTESLYRSIDRTNGHRLKITQLLTSMRGRAALAWYDRSCPGRVMLARAAMSPLVIAFDGEGNFYWGSSPEWFRDIDKKFNGAINFTSIRSVREGTLLTVDFSSGIPEIEDFRSFKPTARWSDRLLPNYIVLRGFSNSDITVEEAHTNHFITSAPKTRKGVYAIGGKSSKARQSALVFSSDGHSIADRNIPNYDISARGEVIEGTRYGEWWDKGLEDDYVNAMINHKMNEESQLDPDEIVIDPDDDTEIYAKDIATEDELMEAEEALDQWVRLSEKSGVSQLVIEALEEALEIDDFTAITKDFGFKSIISAEIFAYEVLDHPLVTGLVSIE